MLWLLNEFWGSSEFVNVFKLNAMAFNLIHSMLGAPKGLLSIASLWL